MRDLSVYQIFIIFIIYSFIGWSCEVLYCSLSKKKFINRGFLFGPICPIYGCGALIVFGILQPLENNLVLLFFAAMILTSVLEYFTSWILEKLFATKWWDYSNYKFNIHGRVCLLNSTLFGVLGVIAVKYVNPLVMYFVNLFDSFWIKVISVSLIFLFSVDLFFTVRSLINFKVYLRKIEEFIQVLVKKVEQEKWVIDFHDNVEDFVKKVKEKISFHENHEKKEINKEEGKKFEMDRAEMDKKVSDFLGKRKSYKRLMDKFPNSKSKKFPKSLEHIKSLSKK